MLRISALVTALALALAGCTTVDPYTGQEKVDPWRTGAAVAGAAAVGALVYKATDDDDDDDDRYYRGRRPFSPSRDVVYYPEQRRCYNDGDYSGNWTRRVFGR